MPISRRPAARRPLLAKPSLPDALRERRHKLLQRHRLDAGLSRQGGAGRSRAARGAVGAAVGLGLGGIGLFMGWLQGLWPLGAAGAVLAVGSGVWAWRTRPAPVAGPLASAWDAEAAARLDGCLQRCAGQLPAEALVVLERLQATLARMAGPMQRGAVEPPFRPDDALFIAELMRRYLPDSVEAYLRVPAAQRGVALADAGASAQQLLVQQLEELAAQLAPREARLVESQATALLRQGEFLRVKRGD